MKILVSSALLALSWPVAAPAFSQPTPQPAISGPTSPQAPAATSASSIARAFAHLQALANTSHPGASPTSQGAQTSPSPLSEGDRPRVFNLRNTPASAQSGPALCSETGAACSTNWSGLEAYTPTSTEDALVGVEAKWTVPAVSPTSTAPEDSSTWIGLDGDPTYDGNSSSLIQIGTDSPSEDGSIYYEAWYELYPGAEIPLFPVSPGDQIQAVINGASPANNQWDLAIADLTRGTGWSKAFVTYDTPGMTAEWVEEASTLCQTSSTVCATSQLQDFGSTTFTNLDYYDGVAAPTYETTNYMVGQDGNVIAYPTFNGQTLTVTYGSPLSPVSAPGTTLFPSNTSTITGDVASGTLGIGEVCIYIEPVADPKIALYETESSDPGGGYAIGGIAPGTYVIQFDPLCRQADVASFAGQYYNGATGGSLTLSGATQVQVSDETFDANAALSLGANADGSVTEAGTALAGICVYAYDPADNWSYLVYTDTGGGYQFGNVTPGTYYIWFDPTCGGTVTSSFAPMFYNSAGDSSSATSYSFAIGPVGQLAPQTLEPGASISGVVTGQGPFAQPLANVCVSIVSPGPLPWSYSGETQADGTFTLSGLPASNWSVYIDPSCGGTQPSDFSPEYYGGGSTAPGTEVSTTAGQAGPPLSISLPFEGQIPNLVPSSLPGGTVGTAYSQTMSVTGGDPPFAWSAQGLPPGLVIGSATGVISGTPLTAGNYQVTITATDASGQQLAFTATLALAVVPGASSPGSGGGSGSLGGGGGLGLAPPATTTTPPTTATTAPVRTTTTVPLPPGAPGGAYGAAVTGIVGLTGVTVSERANGAVATVSVPRGAIPPGSTIALFAAKVIDPLEKPVPGGQSYLVSFAVSWIGPNGIASSAKSPITLTIVDPSIIAGDVVYQFGPTGLKVAGSATVNGKTAIGFKTGTDVIVANVPRVNSLASTVAVSGKTVKVAIRCGAAIKCTGAGTLAVTAGKTGRQANLIVANGKFVINPAAAKDVSFAETTAGTSYLEQHAGETVRGTLLLTVTGGAKLVRSVVIKGPGTLATT
ncbi:MAG TPA: G1 family glutamic endopeptidase [Acidimicrobiales bacterium]|nr:G1 family glutamic endopeptidase [Acidimicrobiales bacterium]